MGFTPVNQVKRIPPVSPERNAYQGPARLFEGVGEGTFSPSINASSTTAVRTDTNGYGTAGSKDETGIIQKKENLTSENSELHQDSALLSDGKVHVGSTNVDVHLTTGAPPGDSTTTNMSRIQSSTTGISSDNSAARVPALNSAVDADLMKPVSPPIYDKYFPEENIKTYSERISKTEKSATAGADAEAGMPPTVLSNPFIYAQAKSRANPPIDLFTVERPKVADEKPTKLITTNENNERVFQLKEAPTYRPSAAEFADPVAYVRSLTDEAKKYGMIKVVPPRSWQSPLGIDIDLFWFKTRRQNLSLRGYGPKAHTDFVNSLHYFHKQKNSTIVKLPSIDKRPLDLFHLYQCVQLRGGFDEVCKKKLWAQIGRELGYSGRIMTSLSTSLKSTYQKLLLPFVQYLRENGASILLDGVHTPIIRSPQTFTTDKRPFANVLNDKPLSGESKKRFKFDNGLEATNDMSLVDDDTAPSALYPRVSDGSHKIHRLRRYTHAVFNQDENIPIINEKWFGNSLIMDPETIPAFRESPTYNFRQFQQKADKFKADYFSKIPKKHNSKSLSTYMIEDEYWKVLTDPSENIEVEHGTDVHSSVHGSAFPQLEWVPHSVNRLRESSELKDPWNFNSLTYSAKSAFRHVSSEIPYLTEPWLSIGMVFATQAWSFEDFFSSLFDYMHFGEPKTWYSVPEKDFDKFKQLLVKVNEENSSNSSSSSGWIENQYMISPQMLKEHGIACYVLDQQPGEFIITFPKAYHAEFAHGFNFSECVNFHDVSNWLGYAMECLDLYNQSRTMPPFSIARTLLNMRLDSSSSDLPGINQALQSFKKTEIDLREKVRLKFPYLITKTLGEPSESICSITKDNCFFSWIRNPLSGAVYSLKAFLDLNLEPGVNYEHLVSLTDEQLKDPGLTDLPQETKPSAWLDELYDLFQNHPKPHVRDVREALYKAVSESKSNEIVDSLRAALTKAAVLIERVQRYFDLGDAEKDQKSENGGFVENATKYMVLPEDFQKLVDDVSECSFSCEEFDKLRARAKEIVDFKRRARQVIARDSSTMDNYLETVQEADTLNVYLPEVRQLRELISNITWEDDYKMVKEDVLDLGKIDAFLAKNRALETLPSERKRFVDDLIAMQTLGKSFASKVNDLLESTKKPPKTIDQLFEDSLKIPMYKDARKALMDICYKNSTVAVKLLEFKNRSGSADVFARPSYSQVARLIGANQWLDNKMVVDALANLKTVEKWLEEGQQMIGQKGASPQEFKSHIKTMNEVLRDSFSLNDNFSASTEDEDKKKRCCICRSSPDGTLARCSSCREYYHLACYNKKAEDAEEFRCSICDWTVVVPRESPRPFYKEFVLWVYRAHSLPYQADELLELAEMVSTCKGFEIKLQHTIMKPGRVLKQVDIPEIKFYLRKLEGAAIFFPGPSRFLFDVLKRLDSRHFPWKSPYADLPDKKRTATENGSSKREAEESVAASS